MSNFQCEKCGTICYDTPKGYVTGCQHYPADWVLLTELKEHIKGYGLLSDLDNNTYFGFTEKELSQYSEIWEDFEVDESIEPYCVGTKFHGNYDIPYREIPVGTLRVYGKVDK